MRKSTRATDARRVLKAKGTAMRVSFFGKLRDALGDGSELPAETGETVADLRLRLAAIHPQAADALLSGHVRACVDDAIVGEDFSVDEARQIEFLPPVSGG